jgi:hypothetical protein
MPTGAATHASSQTTTAVTLEITGAKGAEVFTFAASTAVSAILFSVNQAKDITGVSAALSGSEAIDFDSVGYGSKEFVSVKALTGTFDVGATTRANGTDATVLVNGSTAVAYHRPKA